MRNGRWRKAGEAGYMNIFRMIYKLISSYQAGKLNTKDTAVILHTLLKIDMKCFSIAEQK